MRTRDNSNRRAYVLR
ncbi:hypothetical protein ID866_11205, partial [Astraeus odoratus]